MDTSKAAAALGKIGGKVSGGAKAQAARENGKLGGRPVVNTDTAPKLHKDHTITYWSVYRQVWVRHARELSNEELAALDPDLRQKVIEHTDRKWHE